MLEKTPTNSHDVPIVLHTYSGGAYLRVCVRQALSLRVPPRWRVQCRVHHSSFRSHADAIQDAIGRWIVYLLERSWQR